LASEHFHSLPTTPAVAAPKAKYEGGDLRTVRNLEQLHIMLGFEGVAFHHKDYYAWQVLSTLLGGGMSSRLFQEVREKRGLAYTIQAFVSSHADTGILGTYAATSEDKAGEMISVLCDEVKKLCDGVTGQELQRAKNQIKST